MATQRLLVNFFYAPPVGHAIEALHYCLGHHAADPSRHVAVALNSATATELAAYCPFVSEVFAVDHPFVKPCRDSDPKLAAIPARWDWIVDDFRRSQDIQLALFPGMRGYYDASDRRLIATLGRSFVCADPPGYVRHQRLKLELPEAARASAASRLARSDRWIAIVASGSGERWLYPSVRSWLMILDALTNAFPGIGIALIGKHARDGRTFTSLNESDLAALLNHRSRPLNCFDIRLTDQLAIVEACDLLVAPHTGFGMAALAVGTPWLALSGGRWFEYFFNHVPFRSIIPDPDRYPSFSQFEPAPVADDGDDGLRTPTMTVTRFRDDTDRIVTAAGELLDDSLSYEQSLRDYFSALLAACRGDPTVIWSIDGVHLDYVGGLRL